MSLKTVIAAASVGTLATTVAASCEVGDKAIFVSEVPDPLDLWIFTKGYWTPGPDGQWNGEWTEVNEMMLFPDHVQGEVLNLPTPLSTQYYIRLERFNVPEILYEVISESGEIFPESSLPHPTPYDMYCESSPGYSVPAADVPSSFVEVQLAEGSAGAPCKVGDHVTVSCPNGSGCTYKDGEQGFWAEDAAAYDLGKEGEPIWVMNKSSGEIQEVFGDGNYKMGISYGFDIYPSFAQQGENPYTNKYTGESTTFVMECYSP